MITKIKIKDATLYHADCMDVFDEIQQESIDLTLTSPPYDDLRTYNNTSIFGWPQFIKVASTLWRITKKGGIVVWVVGDSTVNGSETGNSFKQALFFKECGFNLHDTMIYQKNCYPFPPVNRYYQQFEYMFVFSKRSPNNFNGLRQKTKHSDRNTSSSNRDKDGNVRKVKYKTGLKDRLLDNVWLLETGYMKTTKEKRVYQHPAMYPEELAIRHIATWSNEKDIVLDPFMGSGSTGIACGVGNRKFIGIEKEKSCFDIACKRIEWAYRKNSLF